MLLCRETFLKTISRSSALALSFLVLTFIPSSTIFSGQGAEDLFEVSNELVIPTEGMSFDYRSEDLEWDYFHFEYPKIVIDKNNTPKIFFVDKRSQKLIIGEIVNDSYKITGMVGRFSEFNHDSQWQFLESREWPIVFLRDDVIHFVYLPVDYSRRSGRGFIYFYVWDGVKLNLRRKVVLRRKHIPIDGYITGIYPYDGIGERYLVVGVFIKDAFSPLFLLSPLMGAGDWPKFDKNLSLVLEGDELTPFQRIEKQGWYSATYISYAVSRSGVGHCAWVQDTSHVGRITQSSHTVCYSVNKDGLGWSEPLEIYKKGTGGPFITGTPPGISDLSIACNDENVYLLWKDDDEGIYFAEVQDDALIEKAKIKDIYPDSPIYSARPMKIVVDHQGDIFALLNRQHEMVLIGRVSGKWMPPIIVARGYIESPDIAIDSNGIIHITYTKGYIKGFACYCYYRKVSPRKDT